MTFVTLVDVPSVKLDPAWMYSGSETSAQHEAFIMSEGMNAVDDSGNLNLLSRASRGCIGDPQTKLVPTWFLWILYFKFKMVS